MNPRALAVTLAIAHYEGGFSFKSLAYKNNNPGNLRSWGALPTSDGFAHFNTMADGCAALYRDVLANSGKPLKEFMAKYAPSSENNTDAYLAYVSQWSGIQPSEAI